MFNQRIDSSDPPLTVRDQVTPLTEVFLSLDTPQREHCTSRARRVPGLLGRSLLSPDDGEARCGDLESVCERGIGDVLSVGGYYEARGCGNIARSRALTGLALLRVHFHGLSWSEGSVNWSGRL